MKLYRNAIILTVVLALAVGAYFFVKSRQKPITDQKNSVYDSMIKLTDFGIDDIDNITIQTKTEKMVLAKITDEDWGLTYPQDIKSDKAKSKSIALNLVPLYASKVIEENAASFSKYGLDNPTAEVTVKLKDGSDKIIQYGNKTATGENYYAKLKESNTVYTISNFYAEKMIITLYDIKDKTLFTETVDDVTGISLWRKNEVIFSANKGGTSTISQISSQVTGQAYSWILQAPIKGNADITQLQPVIESVTAIPVEKYIEKDASDLSKYGLDNPSYAFEITTKMGDTKKMFFGSEDPGNAVTYAKMDGSNEIFTVKTSYLNFVDKPLKDVVDVFAYIVSVDEINKVEFTMNGNTDVFTLASDPAGDQTKNAIFTMNGKPANGKDAEDVAYFREFYKNIIGIRMEDVESDAKPSGRPDVAIAYYNKTDGSAVKVEFIKKDDYNYYVVKNDEYSGIIVSAKTFASDGDLVKSYNGLKKSVYE